MVARRNYFRIVAIIQLGFSLQSAHAAPGLLPADDMLEQPLDELVEPSLTVESNDTIEEVEVLPALTDEQKNCVWEMAYSAAGEAPCEGDQVVSTEAEELTSGDYFYGWEDVPMNETPEECPTPISFDDFGGDTCGLEPDEEEDVYCASYDEEMEVVEVMEDSVNPNPARQAAPAQQPIDRQKTIDENRARLAELQDGLAKLENALDRVQPGVFTNAVLGVSWLLTFGAIDWNAIEGLKKTAIDFRVMAIVKVKEVEDLFPRLEAATTDADFEEVRTQIIARAGLAESYAKNSFNSMKAIQRLAGEAVGELFPVFDAVAKVFAVRGVIGVGQAIYYKVTQNAAQQVVKQCTKVTPPASGGGQIGAGSPYTGVSSSQGLTGASSSSTELITRPVLTGAAGGAGAATGGGAATVGNATTVVVCGAKPAAEAASAAANSANVASSIIGPVLRELIAYRKQLIEQYPLAAKLNPAAQLRPILDMRLAELERQGAKCLGSFDKEAFIRLISKMSDYEMQTFLSALGKL